LFPNLGIIGRRDALLRRERVGNMLQTLQSSSVPLPAISVQKMPKSIDNAVSQVVRIAHEVTVALNESTSLNPLADLISLLHSSSDPLVSHKAIYAVYRIFVLVISSGRLKAGTDQPDEVNIVRTWLVERLEEYIDLLCGFLKDDQEPLRVCLLLIFIIWC
jgi:U3 small nucleolar RNA-associated protein 19